MNENIMNQVSEVLNNLSKFRKIRPTAEQVMEELDLSELDQINEDVILDYIEKDLKTRSYEYDDKLTIVDFMELKSLVQMEIVNNNRQIRQFQNDQKMVHMLTGVRKRYQALLDKLEVMDRDF